MNVVNVNTNITSNAATEDKALALSHFGHANATIAKMVKHCFDTAPLSSKAFRLAVDTPDDDAEPILGQYALEASVLLECRNTAFSEIVSAACAETRKDTTIPVAERGRSLSGYTDQYDGQDEPEIDQSALETNLDDAIVRAEMICKYMDHIASIPKGGAEWLKGFRVSTWVPTEVDDEAVKIAISAKADLSKFIEEGRVTRGWETIDNRLISFNEWCAQALKNPKTQGEWRNKLAYARTMNISLDWAHVPVNNAMDYIGDTLNKPAFNRTKSRLQEAVERVGNKKYFNLVHGINDVVLDESRIKRLKDIERSNVTWLALPYSEALQKDLKEVKLSDAWQEAEEKREQEEYAKQARELRRQALREQSAAERMAATVSIMKMNAETQAMRLAAAKQMADMQKQMDAIMNPPKPKAKTTSKPKAKTTSKPKAKTK